MKRQHRSTIELCMKYLRRCLVAFGGNAYAETIISDDVALENTCDAIAENMRGDLTFDNWRVACDVTYPI